MYLSVVFPAYNEAAAILAGKLAQAAGWLAEQPYEAELLVVDDGSTDETALLARRARLDQGVVARVISIEHAGKAAAVVAGLRQARGQVVLLSDMDLATPITETPKLLDALQRGEVAVGSRGLRRAGAPAARYLLSWGQMGLRQVLLGLRLTDTPCGYKAFRRAEALRVLEQLYVYQPARLGALRGPSVSSGFDVEFLYVARRLGYRICEVPVAWNYQATRRVNVLREAWRGVRDLARIVAAAGQGRYPSAPGDGSR